jgi:hypothetical protein
VCGTIYKKMRMEYQQNKRNKNYLNAPYDFVWSIITLTCAGAERGECNLIKGKKSSFIQHCK